MTEENGGSDFSIDLPPREVLQRVDRYMLDWGFSIGLNNRTPSTAEYSVVRHKRFPLRLLVVSPDFYSVRLSIQEEGKRRTGLTVKTSHRGRWPDVEREIE